jgi:hypothetical protein
MSDDTTYDSRPDTWAHIHVVQGYMLRICADLTERAWEHDQSKLESPEVEVFDRYTPLLRDTTYGSTAYYACLVGMGEGLEHHYNSNGHHPENHANGIADMTLLDITEMLCDWKAATERHDDGDLRRSIEQNAERFGYGLEIQRLLTNTAEALGWLDDEV